MRVQSWSLHRVKFSKAVSTSKWRLSFLALLAKANLVL